MEDLFKTYWPQGAALVAFIVWLIRLESMVRGHATVIIELRREQAEINRRAQDQAITLAAIKESLSSIKITLDRLYERMDRRS